MKLSVFENDSLDYLGDSCERALDALRAAKPLRCSDWATLHWMLSNESSAQPGYFRPTPYQIGLMDILTHDNIPTVVVQKSARVGFTTVLTVLTFYHQVHKARNTITYNPNEDLAAIHMQARLRPAVRDVPILRKYTSGLGSRKVAKSINLTNGTILRSLGGSSTNNYRAIDADTVIFDELDGIPRNLGEGDPISLGRMRSMASPRPKLIIGTTPLISGESLVQDNMKDAELKLKFKILCPSCNSRESIEWSGADGTSGIRYDTGKPDTASWICPKCGAFHGYEQQRSMVQSGRWESDNGTYWEDNCFKKDYETVSMPRSVGVFIWSAYNPRQQWSEICHVHSLCGNDQEKKQSFENTWLGLFYEPDIVVVEPDPLYRRREEYAGVPDEVICITAGIDVQSDRVECHFIGWGPEPHEEAWSLDYRVYMGDPNQSHVWKDLYQDLQTGLPLESDPSSTMPVIQAVVDSGYATYKVYEEVKIRGHRILYAGKGSNNTSAPLITVPRKRDRKHDIYLVSMGVTNGKDLLFSRLLIDEEGPGYIHLNSEDYEWYQQLVSEEKRPVKRNGRTVLQYQQVQGVDNEVLDTTVYAICAYKIAEKNGRNKNRTIIEGGGVITKPAAPVSAAPTIKKKKRNLFGL